MEQNLPNKEHNEDLDGHDAKNPLLFWSKHEILEAGAGYISKGGFNNQKLYEYYRAAELMKHGKHLPEWEVMIKHFPPFTKVL